MVNFFTDQPLWGIAFFFLGLAIFAICSSVHWHTKYDDLKELVDKAYEARILEWRSSTPNMIQEIPKPKSFE